MDFESNFELDMNLVEQDQEEMDSKPYYNQKDIPANSEVDIRIMPSPRSLGGRYYLKATGVWINDKKYYSPRTFGEACPMLDFVDEILKGDDDELKKLLEAKKFNIFTEYLMPIMLLNVYYDGNEVSEILIDGNKPKVFTCSYMTLTEINSIVTNRHYQTSKLGILDRSLGHNVTISKEVKKRTSYKAVAWPTPYEFDAKYYRDIPDVVEYVTRQLYSAEYLEEVVANYFYGERMPNYDERGSFIFTKESIANPAGGTKKSKKPAAGKAKKTAKVAGRTQDSRKSKSKATSQKVRKAPTRRKGGSLMDRVKSQQEEE